MRKFCPACGKTTELVDGLCPECYAARKEVIREGDVKLIVCSTCGKYFEKGLWLRNAPEELVKGKLRVHGSVRRVSVKGQGKSFTACAETEIKGVAVKQEKVISIDIEKRQCPLCVKERGQSHEAILQVRGGWEAFQQRFVWEGVVRMIGKREGPDFYFAKKNRAKAAAQQLRRLGATVRLTHKLFTKKAGKRYSRITIAARF